MPIFGAKSRAMRGCASKLACGRRIDPADCTVYTEICGEFVTSRRADVGIAIRDGAAIAREVADITVGADNLYGLLTLKKLSDALMARIHHNYRFIISFNFMLICLGVAGILPPATSALLHNASTLMISLRSMTNLLEE